MSIILAFGIFFQRIFFLNFLCNKDFVMRRSLFILRAPFAYYV
jgi:hypothetical protein